MAFKLGDIIIDRLQIAMAEDFSGNPLYTLTQLQEATIETSAESTDAVDKTGTLVKRFWKGKTGTFTATNSMLNVDIMAAGSGSAKKVASGTNKIPMPKIETVKAGSTITLAKGYDPESVTVNAYSPNGTMGASFKKGEAANATDFTIATDSGILTPPTADGETMYVVKYDRDVEDGIAIHNKADKFPKTVKLTIKALFVDPCTADTLRAGYIVIPSFQVSPEVSISTTTDATLDYTGDMQVDYCSEDKVLYQIFMAADDEEDE